LAYTVSADAAATVRGSTATREASLTRDASATRDNSSSERELCRPKRVTNPEGPPVLGTILNAASDAREVAVHGSGLRLRRLRPGLRVRLADRARLGVILLLHVDAALEVRAVGDGHARGDDVTLDRSGLLDVDLLGGVQVAGHLAENDNGLGADLRLDAAVR